MAFYKVRISRYENAPSQVIVRAFKSQDAIAKVTVNLRDYGITDARAIEVVGQAKTLRG